MKSKNYLLIGLLVIGSYSFAGYGENQFKKKIESQILYPKLSSGQKVNAKVHVEFTVNLEGEIIIDKIDSTNKEINDYVIERLKDFKVKSGSEVIGKSYKYNFSFEVQK